MNKKGFTLVEIVGVIIILSLLALLAFPPLLNVVKEGEEELDEATKTLIYTASSQYTAKYINDFPKKIGNTYCINVSDLIENELLASTILDDNITLETKIKITISSDYKYEYIVANECVEVK